MQQQYWPEKLKVYQSQQASQRKYLQEAGFGFHQTNPSPVWKTKTATTKTGLNN
jgi:hypothetical protein